MCRYLRTEQSNVLSYPYGEKITEATTTKINSASRAMIDRIHPYKVQ